MLLFAVVSSNGAISSSEDELAESRQWIYKSFQTVRIGFMGSHVEGYDRV